LPRPKKFFIFHDLVVIYVIKFIKRTELYVLMPKKFIVKKSKETKLLVMSRIKELFRQAELVFSKDKKLADEYIKLARTLGMKYKVKIPKELQRKFCKHCYAYLRPGVNCRVRIQNHKIIYSCLECKKFIRLNYSSIKKKE
jgi:RNase P subunit RPR2